jgi:hypothetical protein
VRGPTVAQFFLLLDVQAMPGTNHPAPPGVIAECIRRGWITADRRTKLGRGGWSKPLRLSTLWITPAGIAILEAPAHQENGE